MTIPRTVIRTQRDRVFSADFETTVYAGQTRTDVWCAAIVELYSEDVKLFGNIEDFIEYITDMQCNTIIYFHNLKFDGVFILNYLYNEDSGFTEASERPDFGLAELDWIPNNKMKSGEFKYIISDLGQWYSITIKHGNYFVEIRDSLKLLPFSVKKLGDDFKTKHRKLNMKYDGYRYPNCPISEAEQEYIKNDVLVVKEALEIMYDAGHKKMTIGSCCLEEFKNVQPMPDYDKAFPNLYEEALDDPGYQAANAGEYIRNSYRGGWCYLVPEKANKVFHNGTTADVNSLYPSMMHSESGNYYPIGLPTFWTGDIPPEILERSRTSFARERVYYFVRVCTRFRIKKGYLPFIQIKNDRIHYKGNECLTTSDYFSRIDGLYHRDAIDCNGIRVPARVVMTLTQTDWELMQEHYDLSDTEILDGCWFRAVQGIFDDYIDKYKQMKITSKGAQRQIAKLFLNNLYGKMAMNTDNNFKVAFHDDAEGLRYYTVISKGKKPGYIPAGSAITSYARAFTIRAAQQNFHGKSKPGFIYADTDSIHCDLQPEEIKGIKVDPTAFCCWKLESEWSDGLYVRQKAYLERITKTDGKEVDREYWDMKCAGMPEICKMLFLTTCGDTVSKERLQQYLIDNASELTPVEEQYLQKQHAITDFRIGMTVPGKLVPKSIPGGIVLTPTTYRMREAFR